MFDNLPTILFSSDLTIAGSNHGAIKLLESCQCSRITDLFPNLPQVLKSFSESNRPEMHFEQEIQIDNRRRYFGIELKQMMAEAAMSGTLASFYELSSNYAATVNMPNQNLPEDSLQASRERSHLLATTALKIRRSLLLDEILNSTVSEVRQLLQADRVVIYRFHPDWSGYIAVESALEGYSKILGAELYDPCFAKIYVAKYQLGHISATNDIYRANVQPCYIKFLEQFQVKASLVVPILIAQEVEQLPDPHCPLPKLWGLLVTYQCSQIRNWQAFEIDLLAQLADQVAIAIQQSELYACLQAELNERKRAEEQLIKLSRAVEHSPSMVIITDTQHNIEYVNPKFIKVTGYTLEEVIGGNPYFLSTGNNPKAIYNELWEAISSGNEWRGEFYNSRKNGEFYWESASISSIKNSKGEIKHFITVSEDITERKLSEATINYLAYHDPLTDLPNRLLFKERLDRALGLASRERRLLALMFLDLDRFKHINDSLGHTVGDSLLQSVAQRVKSCLRTTDTISRMGGDEFMILLPEISHVEDAAKVTEKILNVLHAPFNLSDRELHITASIGISIYPCDGEDSETLWKHADVAMYRAKELGGDKYQIYTPEMDAQALSDLEIANNLRQALERDEFYIHYQPQFDLRTRQIIGVEALLRWHNSILGSVAPDKFIPIAEQYSMLPKIDGWVMKEACAQNKAWQELGIACIPVAVNVSASQFQQSNFAEIVERTLGETGLDPSYLELEITESVVMKDEELAIRIMHRLRRMGIRIAIDDFGTGYSSLGKLKHFPIQKMKIDRMFVKDITTNKEDETITQAIIAMSHSLNMEVIAEGVETQEQLELLRSLNCDEVQGYLFYPPLSAGEITQLFVERVKEVAHLGK
jgi:diguanylate cyclase (GGDEF)-like protein/PAS domain S-box-containing protein